MPKLACPCGFVHNLSPIPDEGWITVRDAQYEELIDAEALRGSISGKSSLPSNDHPRVKEYDNASGVVLKLTGRMYECPECGRLMWEKPGADNQYSIYTREA